MNDLEKLIQELCPDGVEYKELKSVFEMRNGYTPSKAKAEFWEGGTIPWFRMEDIRETETFFRIRHNILRLLRLRESFSPPTLLLWQRPRLSVNMYYGQSPVFHLL